MKTDLGMVASDAWEASLRDIDLSGWGPRQVFFTRTKLTPEQMASIEAESARLQAEYEAKDKAERDVFKGVIVAVERSHDHLVFVYEDGRRVSLYAEDVEWR